MNIPWLVIIRYVLLIAAAWFSFLIWRWNHFDSRRDREQLLRNRFVLNDILYRIPDQAIATDDHYEFSVFRVRVKEEGGIRNFWRKIRHADFQGSTELSVSSVFRAARSSTARDDPRLPEYIEKVSSENGVDFPEREFRTTNNTFTVKFDTADPEEVEEKYGDLIDEIENASGLCG